MQTRERTPAIRSETLFAVLVAVGYLLVAGAATWAHEPWRDETHAWLIARDSPTLTTLLWNMRYDGHPALWQLLLWPLTRLGGVELMQVLAVGLGAAVTFVFARFAPFPRAARALFAFGYLMIWEWGAIARNYGVGVLLLFVVAALFAKRKRYALSMGALLALAANTSAVAAFSVVGVIAMLVWERLAPWRDPAHAAPPVRFWGGVALAGAGVLACAVQVMPPADSAIAGIWNSRTLGERIGMAIASPIHGFASLPWGGALDGFGWLRTLQIGLAVLVTGAVIATAVLVLLRRRGAWIAAVIPALALLSLFVFRYYGGTRHASFLLVSLLLALWAAPSLPLRPGAWRWTAPGEGRIGVALAMLFAFQTTGTALQALIDGRGVYSAGRATAELVRQRGLEAIPLVGNPDYLVSHVLAFLGKRDAYYANVERWGSFDVWDRQHAMDRPNGRSSPDGEVFARAVEMSPGTDVLVILSHLPDPATVARANARFIGSRLADFRKEESYWVYLVPGS